MSVIWRITWCRNYYSIITLSYYCATVCGWIAESYVICEHLISISFTNFSRKFATLVISSVHMTCLALDWNWYRCIIWEVDQTSSNSLGIEFYNGKKKMGNFINNTSFLHPLYSVIFGQVFCGVSICKKYSVSVVLLHFTWRVKEVKR